MREITGIGAYELVELDSLIFICAKNKGKM
jgi:hypothetical protein